MKFGFYLDNVNNCSVSFGNLEKNRHSNVCSIWASISQLNCISCIDNLHNSWLLFFPKIPKCVIKSDISVYIFWAKCNKFVTILLPPNKKLSTLSTKLSTINKSYPHSYPHYCGLFYIVIHIFYLISWPICVINNRFFPL